MAQVGNVFRCNICGHVIVVVQKGGGTLVCCNQAMEALAENSTDAAQEKHVPVVEKIDGGYKVTVGSAPHPMQDEHFIAWIEVSAGDWTARRWLHPGDAPEAVFHTDADAVSARAYCNLHGLWKG